MKLFLFVLVTSVTIFTSFLVKTEFKGKANKLCHNFILVDTHIDLPDWLFEKKEDVSIENNDGQFDFERARKGGLNAGFMSIYVSSDLKGEDSYYHANELIDLVEYITKTYPDKFKIATSVEDIRNQFENKIISLPMGMENGSPINGMIDNLNFFYDRGIRYITLCHNKSNDICDSSTDPNQPFGGLSLFGVEVVKRMNQLGIMVDVSHVSDSTILDVLQLSTAPIIASHSGCKVFTPDFPRNLSDDLIQKIAEKRGVIMVNFGNMFLNQTASENFSAMIKDMRQQDKQMTNEETDEFMNQYVSVHPISGQVSQVADQIDHIVKLVGDDYVGFGSDFDGVGPFIPTGLEDVSKYPDLVDELLERGYSDESIQKICGENLLRVWKEVEDFAKVN